MHLKLIKRVREEEKVAIEKWGQTDKTPEHLLSALLEEAGEVAHAINHDEGVDKANQEIVETIGVLSRIYNMINGCIQI